MNSGGFIKFIRSGNALALLTRPKAFALLALIAQRARRSGEMNIQGLGVGEALVGDHKSIGLTPQEYRTAKRLLEKLGIATFQGTSKGTIAKLLDKSVFDINMETENEQVDKQATSGEQTDNEQTTTNKNEKKEKNYKNNKNLKEYANFRKSYLKTKTMSHPSYEEVLRYR